VKPEAIEVKDGESFIRFARALAEEAERVENLIRADPKAWAYSSPEGWQNTSVSAFLWAAISYFEYPPETSNKQSPTWRDLSEFLINGKVVECERPGT
jgi:hypothetical protein